MNGSQFTGGFKAIIQIYKLGQCKTCLFKIISLGILEYETFFFFFFFSCGQIVQAQEKYALSRKKQVYFICPAR